MGYLISLIIFMVISGLAVVLDLSTFTFDFSNLVYFIDPSSLLIILIPTLVFGIASSPRGTFGLTLRLVFGPPLRTNSSEVQHAVRLLTYSGNTFVALGVIGLLIGMVLLLQNLDDPKNIGPAVAIAVLTLFYGVILKLLCDAGARKLNQNQSNR